MSRVFDALVQAGLPNIFKAEPEEFQISSADFEEVAPFAEQVEVPAENTSSSVALDTANIQSSLEWNKVGVFYPDATPEAKLVALGGSGNLGAEKFRLLRAKLQHLRDEAQLKSIVVTSAIPEDGKSLVALNLAISLAQHTEEKVLLIEGDSYRPVFAQRLGIEGCEGASEWLRGEKEIEHYIYKMRDFTLWVLPSGASPGDSMKLSHSPKFTKMIELFRNCFDWILIDAPPLLPLADVSNLSQQSDGILLVVREGKTPAKLLKKGLATLDSTRLVGVVLNDCSHEDHTYYYRYYGDSPQS
jgi:capsular exopolysaccharide synthesis family protein